MDFNLFKLDIDELIREFAEPEYMNLAEFKKVWLSKKFSFIFEASPTSNQGCFMQTLYAHAIGYMVSSSSLPYRLGGLYCLYCLYETQPFKPPFKIYMSIDELRKLKDIARDAKTVGLKVVSALLKSMLERNMFLFGFVGVDEGSVTDRVNELTTIQNARVQTAYKKLFENTRLEDFIGMNMGVELDVDLLKKRSSEYAFAKELAIKEASQVIDIENIKHIAENQRLIGDVVEKTATEWEIQKELFLKQTGFDHPVAGSSKENLKQIEPSEEDLQTQEDDNDDYCNDLELMLSD